MFAFCFRCQLLGGKTLQSYELFLNRPNFSSTFFFKNFSFYRFEELFRSSKPRSLRLVCRFPFGKRVQRYALSTFHPNFSTTFFQRIFHFLTAFYQTKTQNKHTSHYTTNFYVTKSIKPLSQNFFRIFIRIFLSHPYKNIF